MTWIDKWERHTPWIMAMLTAILYQTTLAPGVSHTDAGELAAVAYTYGVAHPTGYPLFTLVGWLFTRISFTTVSWQLNFMCMLFVAASGWVWGTFLREFFKQLRTTVKKNDSSYGFRLKMANFAATIGGTLWLLMGRTWWAQSTSAEVYSLQCLLLGLALLSLLKAWYAKENVVREGAEKSDAPTSWFARHKVTRAWLLFAFFLSLCFLNHLTAVVLLPGVVFLFFARFGLKLEGLKIGVMMVFVGILVLVLGYGSLMWVAQSQPAYNWGNAADWPRLWHHMSGKQFSVWMFKGKEAFFENLLDYLHRLPQEMGLDAFIPYEKGFGKLWGVIPVWILLGAVAVQGMTFAFQRKREWAIFFMICFASNVFWASNYSIKDPEPYFSVANLVIAFTAAMLMRWTWLEAKRFAPYLMGLYGLLIIWMGVFNYNMVTQRKVWQYEDYARAAIGSLPQDAILISGNWDILISPGYYLQACEDFRKDVVLLDYSMLHDRHWYPAQLRTQHPDLAKSLEPALSEWEKAVYDFDILGKINPRVLQPRFDAVYGQLLALGRQRPIYISPDFFDRISRAEVPPPVGFAPLPQGMLIKLQPTEEAKNGYVALEAEPAEIRFGGNLKEYETGLVFDNAIRAWEMRAAYEESFGKTAEAAKFRSKIQAFVDLRESAKKGR